ncbi:MAG TPA: type I-F CRISPR-associated helicase Cas3 [Pseudomonas sp.]|nr:type I-F CRISPR-associated helicase Cas3 [Pseudomonas sp.]MBB51848.1 type I-F CRISPR-associated helicase Cas3 [Pseudomonadales bacterium]MBB52339.1 type I-F CRISPR-associated helicase Cas3 [Pseudomonadales bacterium]HCA24274.1 type I-F CRISPR-associated helicase Cas3 [Pseudomonas sp.]|tara:strand:- start:17465 stop:20698 length:3234 start_codon:yes stop_codon:yes gene_type:complete
MNVLLVSQCSKRALTETRRILDQFAERRGERTWQTPITLAGLQTLHKLLRKSARKNTAVACHWIRGKDHSELLWIVGDARQFNSQGATPTNMTQRDVLRAADEDDWHSAEDIRLLACIAALFHDFGKAVLAFQNKLRNNLAIADPYRHEWISLRLFEAFVAGQSDEQWLQRLAVVDGKATKACLKLLKCDGLEEHRGPFASLPPLAKAIGWLIVSHHRMPASKAKFQEHHIKVLPEAIAKSWCGERTDVSPADLKKCWNLKAGLPFDSRHWCEHARKLAGQMLRRAGLLGVDWCGNAYAMHCARLTLMLADHYYSGQPSHARYGDADFALYANTARQTRMLKQRLDEHLIGVEVNASRILRSLPQLTESLPSIARHKGFRQRSADRRFAWQDKAFDLAEGLQRKSAEQGFFGVNMASTGCGKTLANGRIMYALANPVRGARFSIALGLRSLTLQTGQAYRERLGLGDQDMAVMVGGAAVRELYEHKLRNGSESAAPLLPEWQHVHFEGSLVDGPLSRWLAESPATQRLLQAPVLACTIDHLMPATEGVRGGQQIAPMLRLMTSDLVLDEPDDFGLEDLPALARLVNWAGMLGSRVLLSSATLPPALIQGLFDAYLAGRRHYQDNRGQPGRPLSVCCAWFDEFAPMAGEYADAASFLSQHQDFVAQRLRKLEGKQADDNRRKALIKPLDIRQGMPEAELYSAFAAHLRQQVSELHRAHALTDPVSGKQLSIGLIRMANIQPLVSVAQALCALPSAPDSRLHLCVYHSQHPLLVRSAIEGQLDALLARHNPDTWWQSEPVRSLLDGHTESNQVLVVLATPVAEVGRDHDYDWGIVEPSSMRSIIQLAGRIRRHRPGTVAWPNLHLLDTNLKHLRSGLAVEAFCRPGFESREFRLRSHLLNELLSEAQWQHIDARARIQQRENADPSGNLVDLEHEVTRQWVQGAAEGSPLKVVPASLWWRTAAPLTSVLQRQQPFRFDPKGRQRYVLLPDDERPVLHRLDKDGELVAVDNLKTDISLELAQGVSAWGVTDYRAELERLAEQLDMSPEQAARRYGWLDLPAKGCENGWTYNAVLGFNRIV